MLRWAPLLLGACATLDVDADAQRIERDMAAERFTEKTPGAQGITVPATLTTAELEVPPPPFPSRSANLELKRRSHRSASNLTPITLEPSGIPTIAQTFDTDYRALSGGVGLSSSFRVRRGL